MTHIETKKARRATRTRKKIKRSGVLRLSVFRSNRFISAQIIDDHKSVTMVSADDQKITEKTKNKIDRAKEVGKIIAEKALKEKITKVVFDKGPYKYHGRIKALAEGAREGGLLF